MLLRTLIPFLFTSSVSRLLAYPVGQGCEKKKPTFSFKQLFLCKIPYEYQFFTLYNCYVTRYRAVQGFFRLPRISYVTFRFCAVTLAIEHMVYFTSRLRLVNFQRVFYKWTAPLRSKSRRWKRKFGELPPDLLCFTLLSGSEFYHFWLTFLVIYMSHLFEKPVYKRTGVGSSLMHWFKRANMYWEYPYMWPFFNTNMAVHYELMNFFFKIEVSLYRRATFMQDRDMFRALNFPIQLFELPRMWQEDPTKYIVYLREGERDAAQVEKNEKR